MELKTCEPQCNSSGVTNPSIEQRLLFKKERLEKDLKATNDALEALQANPELLKILVLLRKFNY